MSLETTGASYRVCYDESTNTLIFEGRIRSVDGDIYKKIETLMEDASRINKLSMIWDMRSLQDINSAGLGILYRFVAKNRENKDYSLKVKANGRIFWQDRLLPNLKKFMPHVHLEYANI